jgi:hypothetical protein
MKVLKLSELELIEFRNNPNSNNSLIPNPVTIGSGSDIKKTPQFGNK